MVIKHCFKLISAVKRLQEHFSRSFPLIEVWIPIKVSPAQRTQKVSYWEPTALHCHIKRVVIPQDFKQLSKLKPGCYFWNSAYHQVLTDS